MQRNRRAPGVVSKLKCKKVWQACLFIPPDVKGRTHTHSTPFVPYSPSPTLSLSSLPPSFPSSKSLEPIYTAISTHLSFRLDETLKISPPLQPVRPSRKARWCLGGILRYLPNNPRERSRRMIGYLVFQKYRSRALDVRYFQRFRRTLS